MQISCLSLNQSEAELSGRPRHPHLEQRPVGQFAFFLLCNWDPCSCYSTNNQADLCMANRFCSSFPFISLCLCYCLSFSFLLLFLSLSHPDLLELSERLIIITWILTLLCVSHSEVLNSGWAHIERRKWDIYLAPRWAFSPAAFGNSRWHFSD